MSWNSMLMATAVASADPRLGLDPDLLVVDDEDAEAIRMIVRAQLGALKAGRPDLAFELMTPEVQAGFGDAATMLGVLEEHFGPLLDPRVLFFGALTLTPDGLGQMIELVDGGGERHGALILVQRSEEGTWRTHGAAMLPVDVELEEEAA